jgi:hypothetical protein
VVVKGDSGDKGRGGGCHGGYKYARPSWTFDERSKQYLLHFISLMVYLLRYLERVVEMNNMTP